MVQIAFSHFKDFMKEQYPMYEFSIKPEHLIKDMINDSLLSIIGEPPADGNKDVPIFDLPTYESYSK